VEGKPDKFYHASLNKEIEELEPRRLSNRSKEEGKLLFASPDIACATMFLVRIYDNESRKGYSNGAYYFVIANKEKFLELDKGGIVYVLPDANFTCDPNKWQKEWATTEKVKPESKIHFDSALKAMIENGVKVYFVDKEKFETEIKDKRITTDYLEGTLGLTAEK